MLSCWDIEKEKRPAFSDIIKRIERLLEAGSDYLHLGALSYREEKRNTPHFDEAPYANVSIHNHVPVSPNNYQTSFLQIPN